ncbi:MAG: taurine dioxygenase, partial [Sphingomonas bacterium]|nr:taurine dioxygenase [Sphingomonas bacterium]
MNAITALRPDTSRERFAYGHITVDPVTPTIGAEISGIDLRQPITSEIAAEIQKALHDWRVVFFRDQDIS